MKKKSYEFDTMDKYCFIKDLNVYNGISWEKDSYDENVYTLKLYYFKRYSSFDGFVSCNRDYDTFNFDNLDNLFKVFNDIKDILEEE